MGPPGSAPDGRYGCAGESKATTIAAGAAADFDFEIMIPWAPRIWDVDHPDLHTAWVRVRAAGRTLDEETVTFGIRDAQFTADQGFVLNGRKVLLKGVCLHHDGGAVEPLGATCVTFHHQWYLNPWDRLPRLAGGTVHNYNIYVDAPLMLAARRLRDAKVAAMSSADQTTFANNYNFRPSGNGSISTENGAMLVEKSVYIDCVWPLRNNQTDPSNPIYTGKILGLDTIYSFLESNGSTTYVRGNSTDPGNPLGPFQAPIIPFSWNTNAGTPNGVLPYNYTMDDPSQLQSIVTSPTEGAGAGVLTWNKTNWLKSSY